MRWTDHIPAPRNERWHAWFAWFPVNVIGHNAHPGKYVWLETVARRWHVFEYLTPNRWEYAERDVIGNEGEG